MAWLWSVWPFGLKIVPLQAQKLWKKWKHSSNLSNPRRFSNLCEKNGLCNLSKWRYSSNKIKAPINSGRCPPLFWVCYFGCFLTSKTTSPQHSSQNYALNYNLSPLQCLSLALWRHSFFFSPSDFCGWTIEKY